jgi:hypothetical protein
LKTEGSGPVEEGKKNGAHCQPRLPLIGNATISA